MVKPDLPKLGVGILAGRPPIQAKEMFGVAGRWNYYASLLG
jgi:hypothetical protein